MAALGETPSRRRVSSVSTVIHELPGRVTRRLAFQAAANVTFKRSGHGEGSQAAKDAGRGRRLGRGACRDASAIMFHMKVDAVAITCTKLLACSIAFGFTIIKGGGLGGLKIL